MSDACLADSTDDVPAGDGLSLLFFGLFLAPGGRPGALFALVKEPDRPVMPEVLDEGVMTLLSREDR
jgi:hypothetical protein